MMRRWLEGVERVKVLLIGGLVHRQVGPVWGHVSGDRRDVRRRGRSLGGSGGGRRVKERVGRRIVSWRWLIAKFVAGRLARGVGHRRRYHRWLRLLLLLLLLLPQGHVIARVTELVQEGERGRGGILVVRERWRVASGRTAGGSGEVEGTTCRWWYRLQGADGVGRGCGGCGRILRKSGHPRRLLLIGGRRDCGCRCGRRRDSCARLLLLLGMLALPAPLSFGRRRTRRHRGDGRRPHVALAGPSRNREDTLAVLGCCALQALQQIKLLQLGGTGRGAATVSGEMFRFRPRRWSRDRQ